MKKIAVTSIGLGLILAGATGVNASALETSNADSLNPFVEERVVDSKDVFSVEKITDILKIKPIRIEGNDSNHASHKHNNLRSEKLEPTNANGEYILANGNIKISVGKDNKDITIEVLDESINIEYVHMKGGNAFNCYDYKGDLLNGSGKDSGLYCPVNKGGNTPEISHITVFWSEEDKENSIPMTPIEPSKPIEPIEPPTEGDKDDTPMTPIEPSKPIEPPVEEEDVPMTPLEPSKPIVPPTEDNDVPMTPLEPSKPVVPPVEEEDVPMTPLEPSKPIEPTEPPTEGEEDKEDSIPMTPIEPSKPVEPTDSAKDNQNNLDFLTGDNSFNSSKNEDDIIYNNQELVSDNGDGNIFVDSTNNPKTGDVGIMPSIIGIVGSAIGLVMNRKKN